MPNSTSSSSPIYTPGSGPSKPQRFMSPEEKREYNRLRKRALRARDHRQRHRLAPITNIAQALDDGMASGREPTPIATRIALALRQRLDNASHAMTERSQSRAWTMRAITERALEKEMDAIEHEYNGHLPFPDPPEGFGARARSRRTHEGHRKKAAAST